MPAAGGLAPQNPTTRVCALPPWPRGRAPGRVLASFASPGSNQDVCFIDRGETTEMRGTDGEAGVEGWAWVSRRRLRRDGTKCGSETLPDSKWLGGSWRETAMNKGRLVEQREETAYSEERKANVKTWRLRWRGDLCKGKGKRKRNRGYR